MLNLKLQKMKKLRINDVYRCLEPANRAGFMWCALNEHIEVIYSVLQQKKNKSLPDTVISGYVKLTDIVNVKSSHLFRIYRDCDFRITVYRGRLLYRCISKGKGRKMIVSGTDISFSYAIVLYSLLVNFNRN